MTRRLLLMMIGVNVALVGTSRAAQKQPTGPRITGKSTLVDENVKQMLLLMDTDKNGKISKDEWMKFMSAEFDKLDKDKSGELDPKELLKERMSFRAMRFADQGK